MLSLYVTTRSTRLTVNVPIENFISAQPHKSICAEIKVWSSNSKQGTPIYIPEHISQHTIHVKYAHIYIKYVYTVAQLPTLKWQEILSHGYPMIANIANRDSLSTYLSQVTGNYPASTELSLAKQYFDPGPTQGEV